VTVSRAVDTHRLQVLSIAAVLKRQRRASALAACQAEHSEDADQQFRLGHPDDDGGCGSCYAISHVLCEGVCDAVANVAGDQVLNFLKKDSQRRDDFWR